MSALAPTLQAFFTDRLIGQRQASPHTIAAYRDTLRLLLDYAAGQLARQPCQLDISDLDAPLIAGFLDHLEQQRGNGVRTRNLRLAAIHSLFHYAQHRHPEHADDIARVLAIPPKRADRALVTFLADAEIDALLDAPDRATWTGRRDHALLVLAIQTGLRASELSGLRCRDLQLATGPHVSCHGKGRKNRITPLIPTTIAILKVWLAERAGNPDDPLFPTTRGQRLSRDGLERRLTKHVATAALRCPTLREKRVSAHTLRHTAAMRLLHAGVDTTVIALWLGHERVDTTQIYLHADLALKERAIARTTPPDTPPGRYRPPDTLLAFLQAL
ncbi:MAG: site-specific integrase [Actinomycetota bacterium]|nr:site-specific integrase [Actinomycetota bacterium]